MQSHQTIVALPNVAEAVARLASNEAQRATNERGRATNKRGPLGRATIASDWATSENEWATNEQGRATTETAVTRCLQMGHRPIPDGPSARAFVEHRKWLIQLDPDSAILTRTEAYDEYADMCALGGWRPLGRNQFVRALERIGYSPRRQRADGDRARVLDFTQPPVATLAAKAEP
jgi:hypothetical protein